MKRGVFHDVGKPEPAQRKHFANVFPGIAELVGQIAWHLAIRPCAQLSRTHEHIADGHGLGEVKVVVRRLGGRCVEHIDCHADSSFLLQSSAFTSRA